MKFSNTILTWTLSFVLAQSHSHHHHHHHQARHNTLVETRDISSPDREVVTVYELNGQVVSHNEVELCLRESRCVVAGDQVTSASETASALKPTAPTLSPSISDTSEHVNSFSTSAQSNSLTSDAPDKTESVTSTNSVKSTNTLKSTPKLNSSDADQGQHNNHVAIESNFPSGKIDCSQFPSQYGAVSADWVGLGGWTGVQKTPGYSMSSKAISYIETAVAGEGCTPGSFCSYSCPAGYQKSQWPAAQGSTGQSIGGLYCNSNGKLELSRTTSRQLCTPGVGNIKVKNLHKKNVAICRTDYPGTEAETVALNALPGSTVKVTCPDAKDYYRTWEGAPTSAQYYINPSGYEVKDACTWGSPGTNVGNWAPVNMGVGRSDSGSIFVSLFPNVPTNPDGVLDFQIDIVGDVTGRCAYRDGNFYKDGVISPTGCTVGVNGVAVFELS